MKRKANLAKERARVKAQKEEQERNARPHAVASLSTLDIPADLAVIFNKIEGKNCLQLWSSSLLDATKIIPVTLQSIDYSRV